VSEACGEVMCVCVCVCVCFGGHSVSITLSASFVFLVALLLIFRHGKLAQFLFASGTYEEAPKQIWKSASF
jgi:biotin transporter BioY